MLKTLTFTLMHFCIAFGVTYALTGSVAASGLVAAIKPLGLPSRMKALNKLAPVGHKRLTDTTLEWLARQSGSSWRGLGAVAKAMKARLAAEGPVLEHPAGKRLLADLEKPRLRAPDLIRLTAKHFGVTETALKGKGC